VILEGGDFQFAIGENLRYKVVSTALLADNPKACRYLQTQENDKTLVKGVGDG